MTTSLVPSGLPSAPSPGSSAKAKFTLSHSHAAKRSATSVVLQRDPVQSILARTVSACDGKKTTAPRQRLHAYCSLFTFSQCHTKASTCKAHTPLKCTCEKGPQRRRQHAGVHAMDLRRRLRKARKEKKGKTKWKYLDLNLC